MLAEDRHRLEPGLADTGAGFRWRRLLALSGGEDPSAAAGSGIGMIRFG
jgi:hypothetical protein